LVISSVARGSEPASARPSTRPPENSDTSMRPLTPRRFASQLLRHDRSTRLEPLGWASVASKKN
jgi:hypothetical protein